MKRFIRYLISICISVVLAGIVFAYELKYYDIKNNCLLIISNSAFVSGAAMIIAGLLCLVVNQGGVDAVSYTIHRIKSRLKKVISENYTEFVRVRRKSKKNSVNHIFVAGGIMIALAVVTALV